jgi:ribosome-associated protein
MADSDDLSKRELNRRRQRNAGDRSARLAHSLMKIAPSALGKLGLDEDLRDALDKARAITSPIARRRAERTLAGELRRIDMSDLDEKLANVLVTGTAEQQDFRVAEQWRTRMLEGGLAAAAEFPGGTADPLPKLIEQAKREQETGKPPGARRALFRHIVALLRPKPSESAVEDDVE